jgi:hypothetical protein
MWQQIFMISDRSDERKKHPNDTPERNKKLIIYENKVLSAFPTNLMSQTVHFQIVHEDDNFVDF